MEGAPPSHPTHWLSRTVEMSQRQIQETLWELNEEAEKHCSREELRGVWQHCLSLPADSNWTEQQAMAATAIDYIRIVQKLLWDHYKKGCYHRYHARVRRFPQLRPLRGTAGQDTPHDSDPPQVLRPSRYHPDN
ncbi:vpr [Simian immunodeficiency virus]|uniref:Vpr n=1 Tax=Simian immunodeficiency virus TaxID=11723 RepID=A0A075T783_SIV|nr:vpr [Simian immunodeficiency virus]